MSSDDSPDAHTITLDTAAGTLVLNFQPPGRTLDNFAALYLVHNGAIQDARTIAGWGTDQAGTNINGPVTVDMIEPGDYALCRADPAEVSALWTGPVPLGPLPQRLTRGGPDADLIAAVTKIVAGEATKWRKFVPALTTALAEASSDNPVNKQLPPGSKLRCWF